MMRFHLLDRAGTSYLGFLAGARDRTYLAELNGVGAGSFAIDATDPMAATLDNQQIVRVDIGNETVGHWLIESIDETLIDADGESANVLEVSGRSVLALLERAIVYAFGYPGDPGTEQELVFTPSFGDGWFELLNGNVELPFSFSFDTDYDSSHTVWADDVDTSFRCNASMLEVMQAMASLGFDMLLEMASLEMAAYPAPFGDDLTASVIFRQGRDVQRMRRKRWSGELANVVMAIEGAATYATYSDATSITTYGRLEAGIDTSAKTDPAKRAQALRDLLAYPRVTTEFEVNTATHTPFLDYFLGDTVTVWTNAIRDELRIKAIQITQSDGGEMAVALQMSDRTMSFLERLNAALRRSELTPARVYGLQD